MTMAWSKLLGIYTLEQEQISWDILSQEIKS
jgi:hypothetical protein